MRKIALVFFSLMLIGIGIFSGCLKQPDSQTNDENQSPIATCSANPETGTAPLTVNFSGSGVDPDGTIVSYHWNFGDGTTSIEQNPSHTFQSANSYTITFTVEDNDSRTTTETLTITVNAYSSNEQPTSSLTATVTVGIAPFTVTFLFSANDADDSISSWEFDINNDGTPEYSGSGNPPSEQQHTYATAGTYVANFTVTDNKGATGSDTITITVNTSGSGGPGSIEPTPP